MDLSYSTEHRAFAAEVRAFLASHWPFPVDGKPATDLAAQRGFRQLAIDRGYLYRAIPKAYGGSEQPPDAIKAQIIGEEFDRVRAPREVPGNGNWQLVPTLLHWASEDIKQRFIPQTLSGEILWAQGYSEPNAGSDLASLKTRAELRDGQWLINGQKIWSSVAQHCHYMFLLARTEADTGIKQQGISYLLLDLKQPGVTIRPLKQITGSSEFCEVFFDNAKTPAELIVGERGRGWEVSNTTLAHERTSMGGAASSRKQFAKLVALARSQQVDGRPAIEQPLIRDRLTVLQGYLEAHIYSSYRQQSMAYHSQNPGPVTTMNKLVNTNLGHDIARLARDLMDDSLLLAPPQEQGYQAGPEKWNNQFLGSLGVAIAGGTSNIQRNIIAERGLKVVKASR